MDCNFHHKAGSKRSRHTTSTSQSRPVVARLDSNAPSPDSSGPPVSQVPSRDPNMMVQHPVQSVMHPPGSFLAHDKLSIPPWRSSCSHSATNSIHSESRPHVKADDQDSGLGSVEHSLSPAKSSMSPGPPALSPELSIFHAASRYHGTHSTSQSMRPQSPNILVGGNTAYSTTTGHSRRKGVGVSGRSIEEELCLICGDRASGYHYNALSCEGCKGFFRRSITRGQTYKCKYGGSCEMDMWMRRRCQACRLQRCQEVGMKEECLLSDDQCKARDARRKARVHVQKLQQHEQESMELDVEQPSPDSNVHSTATVHSNTDSFNAENPLDCVLENHRELIENIVYYQDKYELPTQEDINKVAKIKVRPEGRPKDMSESMYKIVAEMTILTTELVVEFAKHLPGFTNISRDDQIVLLKGSASEVMILRTARRYDLQSDSVILGTGMPMTNESMKMIGLADYGEELFVFCRQMALLGVDNAEYALITVLSILTERVGLVNPKTIENLHDVYLHALIDYSRYRRCLSRCFLAKLLMKFTDLRTVSQVHAENLYNLKLERVSLPPLLAEYFDIMDD